MKLSQAQCKTIEEYWMNVDDYRKKLKFREWELTENKATDENIGGSKGNQISDTTANKAILLAGDEQYQHLKKVITVIERTLDNLDDELREFAEARYLSEDSSYYDWEGIADELGINRSKAYKLRNKLIDETAKKLGWL